MKTVSLVLATCCLSVIVACARQDEHTLRVAREGRAFVAADCDVLTDVVRVAAGRSRLQETRGVERDSFPRYRRYLSKTSPVGLDLYCASHMLQVTVTAVQVDQADEEAYKRCIEKLSAEMRNRFGSGVEESDDSMLVSTFPW